MKRIGIRIEDKSELERRAPLTPEDVREVIDQHELAVTVQPSPNRIFPDSAYAEAGAMISDTLQSCDLILGIKEVPIERLIPGKPHLFFSHTVKGQPYNMPLLAAALEKKITLIDYELIADDQGRRLIAFSYQAGQAGMINSLWSLGQRLLKQGFTTPLVDLKQAIQYPRGLDEARNAIEAAGASIRKHGFSDELPPLIIGITGEGRVAGGALDVLKDIKPTELAVDDLLDEHELAELDSSHVYYVSFCMHHFLQRKNQTGVFDFKEYAAHPEQYVSRFADYLPHLTVMVNGIYWDERYPRLVTRDALRTLFENGSPRLKVIGDITCDVEGSVESTVKAALPDNPVFVYDPNSRSIRDGFDGEGLLMMTVDILPSEIPETSSIHFGSMLKSFLADLTNANYSKSFDKLALPPYLKRAVIVHQGNLTPGYEYLMTYLSTDE